VVSVDTGGFEFRRLAPDRIVKAKGSGLQQSWKAHMAFDGVETPLVHLQHCVQAFC
jgi:hypothetical protein